MPENQQTQQSTESKPTSQKQATPVIQMPIINPMAIIQRARINPKSLTHADIMQLQRTIGNRAVGRLLSEIRPIPSTVKQVQRQEIPEEEEKTLQSKMVETIQRQRIPEDEELLQGKFESEPEQSTCHSCSTPSIQREKENLTGMPDNLKAGLENLSGIDMNDVRVHYNSDKPTRVGALAYTQGANIHVAPGQEQYLPHEAWHVVQQAQGRVKPTLQLKDVAVNDDVRLELEADEMGVKASQMTYSLKYLEDVNELPQIMGKEEKIAHSRVTLDNILIQLKIRWGDVLYWIESGKFKEYEIQPIAQEQRDFLETKMLIEELKLRYDRSNVTEDFVRRLEGKLDSKPRITNTDVRQAIREVESDLQMPQIETAKPQTREERFVDDLKEHLGYYSWEQGTHDAFIQSLDSQDPSKSKLPINAVINCWEAVLFSAARTGLVDVERLKAAYSDEDRTKAVETLISSGKVTSSFKHYKDRSGNRANQIKVGDIIILEPFNIMENGEGKPDLLHHVVAVIKACESDYFNVEVASLYENLGTGFLTQFPLKVFLERENYLVKVSTLSRPQTETGMELTSSSLTGTTSSPSTSSTVSKKIESSSCCHCQIV